MGQIDLNTFDKVFKIVYPDGIEPLLYEECPAFAWVPKARNFTGRQHNHTVRISGTPGSNKWSVALNRKGAPTYAEFVLKRGEDYAHMSVDCHALAASADQKGALREAMAEAVDSAKYEMGRSMAKMLWGAGKSSRGKVAASGISGTVVTLDEPTDVRGFELGSYYVFSATEDITAAIDGGAARKVTKIDEQNGKVTFDAVGTATDGYFLFREGDTVPFEGFFSWIPKADVALSDALFTSFKGVTRTDHVTRLAGDRIDGGGAPMQDTALESIARNRGVGGRADTMWMNPFDWARFEKEQSSKLYIDINTDRRNFGLKAMAYATGHGNIAVMADEDCPKGHFLLTRRDSWILKSLREIGHVADEDGRKWRFESGADAITGWMRAWGNLFNKAPKHSLAGKW